MNGRRLVLRPLSVLSIAFSTFGVMAMVVLPGVAVAGECPNEQLREENNSSALPDCRAFEQVTPVEKNGQIIGGGGVIFSAAPYFYGASQDGSRVLFGTFTPNTNSRTDQGDVQVATRTPAGWQSMSQEPEPSQFVYPQLYPTFSAAAADPNLSAVLLATNGSLAEQDAHPRGQELYLRTPGETYEWMTQGSIGQNSVGPSAFTSNNQSPTVSYGTSTDLNHVVFAWPTALVPEAEGIQAGFTGLYERFDGETHLVDVSTAGDLLGTCGASLGDTGVAGSALNAVSQDGEQIVFAAPGASGCIENGQEVKSQLYLREEGARTIEISAPSRGVADPYGPQEASFVGATPNDERVFFTSDQRLTANANTGPNDTAADLYEYDRETETLSDMTASSDPLGAQVEQLVGLSANGEVVYFIAKGQFGGVGTEGERNLYVSNAGHVSYIATLGNSLFELSLAAEQGLSSLTLDGKHLLFQSTQNLTSYDSRGYSEVYEYNAETSNLTCVSCTSNSPAGDSSLFYAGERGGARVTFVSPAFRGLDGNNLSADGSYAFFDIEDGDGITNVYEYHNGNLALISTGSSEYSSYFLGATSSGSDVFFATSQSLAASDTDEGQSDLYDARIDGGFPATKAPVPCMSADSCRSESLRPTFELTPTPLVAGEASLAPSPVGVSKPKALTRAQKRSADLKLCKKDKEKAKRATCEKRAREKFGSVKEAKKKAKR